MRDVSAPHSDATPHQGATVDCIDFTNIYSFHFCSPLGKHVPFLKCLFLFLFIVCEGKIRISRRFPERQRPLAAPDVVTAVSSLSFTFCFQLLNSII